MLSLDKTHENVPYRVVRLSLDTPLCERLYSLGLIPETEIIKTLTAPGGDISAYLIRGSRIALRSEYARKITVERISD